MRRSVLALAIALVGAPAVGQAQTFAVTSPDVRPRGVLAERHAFNGFGCTGGNIPVALRWTNPPAGTKSFALTMFDPDAPTGSGFWHWVAFDIPADARKIDRVQTRAVLPAGAVESRTDFGKPGYGGPCPTASDGPHRYVFTLHALGVEKLGLDADASGALVGFMINANRLGRAQLHTTYDR